LRLYELTGDDGFRVGALKVLHAFGASVSRFASAAATYVKAVARSSLPVTRIVVVAEPGDIEGDALFDAALRVYRPRTTVLRLAPGAEAAGLPAELAAMITGVSPRAYQCTGNTCAPPAGSAADLEALMRAR
jgi:uncharacterized protein YyaL (SSP411 family)